MQAGLLARPLTKGRELVAYGAFRNVAINGNFARNQRAVSGTVVLAAGIYGHDRWKAGAGGCTYTFATVNGTTIITISAGTLVQVIEDANVEGGVYCMSWLGSSQGKVGSGGFSASGVRSGTQLSAVSFNIEFSVGTLSNVQLETNASATPFERRPIGLELMLCKRYYQTSYQGVAPGSVVPNGRITTPSSGSYAVFAITLSPDMRATPTVTIYNPSTGATASIRNETAGTDFAAIGFGAPFVAANFLSYQTATAPPPNACMTLHYAATAEL